MRSGMSMSWGREAFAEQDLGQGLEPDLAGDSLEADQEAWAEPRGRGLLKRGDQEGLGFRGVRLISYEDDVEKIEAYKRQNPGWVEGEGEVLRPDGQPLGAGCGDKKTDNFVPDGAFPLACGRHDFGYTIPWMSKEETDRFFLQDMRAQGKRWAEEKPWRKMLKPLLDAQALFYYGAVRTFGNSAYRTAQNQPEWRQALERRRYTDFHHDHTPYIRAFRSQFGGNFEGGAYSEEKQSAGLKGLRWDKN